MASSIQRTVEIIFGAVDQTGAGISSAAKNLQGLADSAQSISAPLADIADTAVKAEAAILSLAAAYGGYALAKAAEFEQSQIDLAKVLTDTDPRIDEFTDSVMKLSEQYGVSSAEVLQGISNFKQAGFTAAEAGQLQKDALDLMIAGDVSAAKASEILISSIKGFGAEASSASRFVEALNNVSNDYATDVEQLAEGMSRVSPILKTMGFSFEEGTGLLTPMIEVFRNGGEAAEALKTGLLKLLDDSKPVASALAQLGVSQTDLNGNMRSGREIFYDVAKAFQTLDENQKLVFAGQLFGIEQAPKLVTVFDQLGKVNEITASAMAVTGSAAKEVDLRLASTAKQADILKVSFENLAISIGQQLNGQFGGIVSGSSSVVQALQEIVEKGGLEPFLTAMRPLVADFSQTLENIAKNLPAAFEAVDFSGLIAALQDLGLEIGDLFGGLDLNTVDGLTGAIQFMVDTFASLTHIVSGVVDAWGPAVQAFVAGQDAFNGIGDGAQKAIGNLLGVAQIVDDLAGGVNKGAAALEGIGDAMSAIAGIQIVQKIKDMADWFRTAGTTGGTLSTAMGTLSGAMKALPWVALAAGAADAANALYNGEKSSLGGALDWVIKETTGFGTMEDFVYSLNLFGEQSRESANKALELEVSIQKLKNATGDASITAENYYSKLAAFADATAKAAEEHNKLGASIDTSKTDFTDLNSVIALSRQISADWGSEIGSHVNTLLALSGGLEGASGDMVTLGNGAGLTVDEFDKLTAELDGINKSVATTGPAANDAAKGFQTLAEAEQYVANTAKEGNARFIEYKDGLWQITNGGFEAVESSKKLATATENAAAAAKKGSEEWKRVQEVMIESQRRADDFTVAMEKLSNERFEIEVKAAVDLKTAEIEANTQRISAAFQATSEVIASLTTGVTDLWSTFAQNNLGPGKSIKLEEAAARMEDRLDAELELKKQMTEAVVAQATATTQRLSSGEPLISIDAGNLAPELELVFDKILKFTQIKATQEGLSLLVGL